MNSISTWAWMETVEAPHDSFADQEHRLDRERTGDADARTLATPRLDADTGA
jgi:hypothetical protein